MAYTYTSVSSGSGINVLIDSVSGNAIQVVKLDLGGEGVSSPISGNIPVSQSGTWNINSLTNPVSSYILGTVELQTPQSGAFPVSIQNPTLIVDGSLDATQSGTWTVGVSGAVAATQSGSWNIGSITNPVTVTNTIGTPLYISPAEEPLTVGGTVAAQQSGPWSVAVSGTTTVAGTVAATQSGTWNVGVSGTATVSGNVNITNSSLAATQSGTWTLNRASSGVLTILSTEMNSLTNSSITALGSGVVNTMWHKADFELLVTYGTNPTAGSAVELYIVPALDDTNYADGASGTVSVNNYAGSFVLRATTSAQRIVLRGVDVPLGSFKCQVKNGAGQTMAASGNTLRMKLYSL